MPPSAQVMERRRIQAMDRSNAKLLQLPGKGRYPQTGEEVAQKTWSKTWNSRTRQPEGQFITFGTNSDFGNNTGQTSYQARKIRRILAAKDGKEMGSDWFEEFPLEENPLGASGSHESLYGGEAIRDPRHGALADGKPMQEGHAMINATRPSVGITVGAETNKPTGHEPRRRRDSTDTRLSTGVRVFDSGKELQAESKPVARSESPTSTILRRTGGQQLNTTTSSIGRASTRRGSVSFATDRNAEVLIEKNSDDATDDHPLLSQSQFPREQGHRSPQAETSAEWAAEREARHATRDTRAQMGLERVDGGPRSVAAFMRGGTQPLKGRLQELKSHYGDGPSTPPGEPPTTVKAMWDMLAATTDMQALHVQDHTMRDRAATILNYGSRRAQSDGQEDRYSHERPLSRSENTEGRGKHSILETDRISISQAENPRYSYTSKPPSPEKHERVEQEIPTDPYERTAKQNSQIVPWQRLKPPTQPMYSRPVTRSSFRKDLWTVVPVAAGQILLASNKLTRPKEGQWEPSLDNSKPFETISGIDDPEPPAVPPWSTDDTDENLWEQERAVLPLDEQDRLYTLRCFTASNSSVKGIHPDQLRNTKITSKLLRAAGETATPGPNKPRNKVTAQLESRIHSLGLTVPAANVEQLADSGQREFLGSALLPGSLKSGTIRLEAPFQGHLEHAMPGAPIHPARNAFVEAAAQKQSIARSEVLPGPDFASTLPLRERPPSPAVSVNSILGVHVTEDKRLQSSRSTLSAYSTLPSSRQDTIHSQVSQEFSQSSLGGKSTDIGELPTDLSELRKLKAEAEQAASFGWTYRRDHNAPSHARGRQKHDYFLAPAIEAPFTAGKEPTGNSSACLSFTR